MEEYALLVELMRQRRDADYPLVRAIVDSLDGDDRDRKGFRGSGHGSDDHPQFQERNGHTKRYDHGTRGYWKITFISLLPLAAS